MKIAWKVRYSLEMDYGSCRETKMLEEVFISNDNASGIANEFNERLSHNAQIKGITIHSIERVGKVNAKDCFCGL